MRIDCRVSLCDRTRFVYPWSPHRDYTAQDLAAILERNRFDGAIVVGQLNDPAETEWLLQLTETHGWIAGVLSPVAEPRFWDRWQNHPKFLGVELATPGIVAELAGRHLLCTLPLQQAEVALAHAPGLRAVVRVLSGVSFEPGEFEAWARSAAALAGTLMVPVQVDGLLDAAGPSAWQAATYQPWVRHLLEVFGPARVLYGSGWPRSMPHATWKESLACFTQAMGARTVEERALILGANASRYYSRLDAVSYTK